MNTLEFPHVCGIFPNRSFGKTSIWEGHGSAKNDRVAVEHSAAHSSIQWMQHTSTHRFALQHTAAHPSIQWMQHTSTHRVALQHTTAHLFFHWMQHTSTHRFALQHTKAHPSIQWMQHTSTHRVALQHTTAHPFRGGCNTLQDTVSRYNTLQHSPFSIGYHTCSTLQHTKLWLSKDPHGSWTTLWI